MPVNTTSPNIFSVTEFKGTIFVDNNVLSTNKCTVQTGSPLYFDYFYGLSFFNVRSRSHSTSSRHTFEICTLSRFFPAYVCSSNVKTVFSVSSSPAYTRSDYISDKNAFLPLSTFQMYFLPYILLIVISNRVPCASLFNRTVYIYTHHHKTRI